MLHPDHAICMRTPASVLKIFCRAVQVERAVVAAGGNPAALAAARNHLGNHYADRRQWAQVSPAGPDGLP